MTKKDLTIQKVMNEQNQTHETRKRLYLSLEKLLQMPVISYFTSFNFPVMIDDNDVDMMVGILQKTDVSKGIALIISSPGGDGLAAERLINVCRNSSGTNEYSAIVPGKAKSAATMLCFGANKIHMGPSSELGPVDPQITLQEDGVIKRFSVFNLVKSYEKLFEQAVNAKSKNLEPYLQQLNRYDERQIEEFRAIIELSEDIAIGALKAGMMSKFTIDNIRKKVKMFLTPEQTKTHGRPIFYDEANKCGLTVDLMKTNGNIWATVYELYIRANNFVNTRASKLIETKDHSFLAKRGN
ncbi:MAG: ATP-dependent Clp protease proteolytic subunit [Deltaproteobacteria bacterium]|nr:ATP-dependent Clp protease proteolytic subunit [Deltaproteobacteria bacterium]